MNKTAKQFIEDHFEWLDTPNRQLEDRPRGRDYNLEGAIFYGEDLRWSDLEGASLEGVTIILYDDDIEATSPYLIKKIIELKGKEWVKEQLEIENG